MMNRKLIDALLFLSGIAAVLLAYLALMNARPEREAIEPVPLHTDEVVLSLPVTPIPTIKPESTAEPTPEPTPVYNPEIPLSEDLQIILRDACEEHGVDIAIALGVIEVESGFYPGVDNGLCYGLMQLNRKYFPGALPPGENICYGVEYLGQLLAQYSTVEAALTAYNAGHDTGSRVYANSVLRAADVWAEVLNVG